MKVLVIGSNSISGATFVDHCLASGDSVVGVSRSPEYDDVFLPYHKNPARDQKMRFVQLDLNKDLDNLEAILYEFQPEYVANFAAQSMVGESWQNPEDWYQTNVIANILFHERLRKLSFLNKYLHVSTPEVYGTCSGSVKEHRHYDPSTPYATSRAATDMSLWNYFKVYNFPVVYTRSANVYGPGQQLYRIIPKTIVSFLSNKKVPLHGGGVSVRSFIHASDVSAGTRQALLKGEAGDIFHFSTKETISIRDLVYKIASKLNVSFEDLVEVSGDRLGKDQAYLLNSEFANSKLGWTPQVSLEQGLEEMISWGQNNLKYLQNCSWQYSHKK